MTITSASKEMTLEKAEQQLQLTRMLVEHWIQEEKEEPTLGDECYGMLLWAIDHRTAALRVVSSALCAALEIPFSDENDAVAKALTGLGFDWVVPKDSPFSG